MAQLILLELVVPLAGLDARLFIAFDMLPIDAFDSLPMATSRRRLRPSASCYPRLAFAAWLGAREDGLSVLFAVVRHQRWLCMSLGTSVVGPTLGVIPRFGVGR